MSTVRTKKTHPIGPASAGIAVAVEDRIRELEQALREERRAGLEAAFCVCAAAGVVFALCAGACGGTAFCPADAPTKNKNATAPSIKTLL